MEKKYTEYARLFKVLSGPNRLMILDMLSCGELCACVILERLHITQPTLSHHMKSLCESKLVNGRREGKWMYYSLNDETLQGIKAFFNETTVVKGSFVCHKISCGEGCGK